MDPQRVNYSCGVIFIIFSEAGKHSKCYILVAFIFITVSYAPDLFCREIPDRQIKQSTRLKYHSHDSSLQPSIIILNAWNRETWHYCSTILHILYSVYVKHVKKNGKACLAEVLRNIKFVEYFSFLHRASWIKQNWTMSFLFFFQIFSVCGLLF